MEVLLSITGDVLPGRLITTMTATVAGPVRLVSRTNMVRQSLTLARRCTQALSTHARTLTAWELNIGVRSKRTPGSAPMAVHIWSLSQAGQDSASSAARIITF